MAVITSIIAPTFLYYFRNFIFPSSDHSIEDKLEDRKAKLDKEINNRLKEVRKTVDADRIWVMEFRQIEEGTPSKIKMIYEDTAQGVSKEIGRYESVNFVQIKHIIDDLLDENSLSYKDISNVENGEVLKMFELEGNVSMYMFAIRSIDSILIGILGIDYVFEERELTDQEKIYMRSESSILAGYLESRELKINGNGDEGK